MTRSLNSSSDFPPPDGTEAGFWVAGIGGADQSNGTRKGISFTPSGQIRRTYKPTGTLTLAETRGGIVTSTSPSQVTWVVPLMYTLGNPTRDPVTPQEIGWLLERGFDGRLLVNAAQYWGEVASQAAMVALSSALTGDWCQRSDQGHQAFVLTGASFSVAGNWTAVPFATAMRPRIAWGAVANNAAMVALSNALVGDSCTKTDDSGNTYQLLGTASGPNYYATAANWIVRPGVTITPGVYINWNSLDPSTLAKDHPEIWLKSKGVDDWVAS